MLTTLDEPVPPRAMPNVPAVSFDVLRLGMSAATSLRQDASPALPDDGPAKTVLIALAVLSLAVPPRARASVPLVIFDAARLGMSDAASESFVPMVPTPIALLHADWVFVPWMATVAFPLESIPSVRPA